MIDKISEKIEEDPFYNDVFAPKEDSPLYFVKLALKWVLKEAEEMSKKTKRVSDEPD